MVPLILCLVHSCDVCEITGLGGLLSPSGKEEMVRTLCQATHQSWNVLLYLILLQRCEGCSCYLLLTGAAAAGGGRSTVTLDDLPKLPQLSGRAGCKPRPAGARVCVFDCYAILPLFLTFTV